MKKILATLSAGLLIGGFGALHAELPAPTAEEKAAAAAKKEKEAAEKAKAAEELAQAQDRAVANYKKNKEGASATGSTIKPGQSGAGQSAGGTPATASGADHATKELPDQELTRKEAQTEMPTPGQANDHSTTARDPQNSSAGR